MKSSYPSLSNGSSWGILDVIDRMKHISTWFCLCFLLPTCPISKDWCSMASLRKIWIPQVWFTRIAGRVWLRCRGGVTRHQLFPQSAGVSPPPFFNLCPYRQFKSATDYARPMHQSGKMKIGNVKAGSKLSCCPVWIPEKQNTRQILGTQ